MKRHSILTTLFPRLPIARHSIPEILAKHCIDDLPAKPFWDLLPYCGAIQQTDGGTPQVVIPNFLPCVSILDKLIKCNLFYEERDATDLCFQDSTWVEHGMDVAENFLAGLPPKKNQALVWTKIDVRSAKGDSLNQFEIPGVAVDDEAEERLHKVYRHMVNLMDDAGIGEEVAEIHFNITIAISQGSCPGYSGVAGLQPNNFRQKEEALVGIRREYLARELTTGYRRYVSLLLVTAWAASTVAKRKTGREEPLVFARVGKACHIVDPGSAGPSSDLHSTTEDAWRLLCTFDNVEDASKTVNRGPNHGGHDYVLCLDSFMDSLVGDSLRVDEQSTAVEILNHLYLKKGIKMEIALRKTLEYYIYEGVPCMPGNSVRRLRERGAV